MFSVFGRKALEHLGTNLMPEESAMILLGVVFELGKEFSLDVTQREGFTKEEAEQGLRKILLCINWESLLHDPHFSLSLYLGAFSAIDRAEKILGRKLNEVEELTAIKMALDDIFPSTLSAKLFQHFVKNGQSFSKLTDEEFKTRVNELYERRRKLFPRPDVPASYAGGGARPVNRGTDTWLVPCPSCGLEKRCDAKTKRFSCKCGLGKPYDGKNRRFP
ncbi:MAG: hypothetical protein A2667_02310 [Candidatus Wildermuthbacteria bacterium RIFCSPHIGHO2_01_FULL_47_27]|nr:MAG: hypothetical protein A2667_02310 [Candidatus Wildermuthbacteria bacterium RIFCSPHIGHO2_01_FULL_47_27]